MRLLRLVLASTFTLALPAMAQETTGGVRILWGGIRDTTRPFIIEEHIIFK